MGSKTARAERQRQREDNTAQLMENIMTGGEISKAREAELQKAANYGRGVQFLEGSPKVGNLTQKGGQPVFRTGTTAQDFTGRIVANAPTFGEALGDAGRALFGGQAERPIFTSPDAPPTMDTGMDFANMAPAPERTEGIIPALVNTGGITGIVLKALRDLIPGQEEEEEGQEAMPSAFTTNPAFFIPQDASSKNILVTDFEGNPINLDRPSPLDLGPISILREPRVFTFAEGGLTPPEKGPMSQGVGSLFQER
jgi:hypothetical protein